MRDEHEGERANMQQSIDEIQARLLASEATVALLRQQLLEETQAQEALRDQLTKAQRDNRMLNR
jgi:hypothetical protein